MMKNFSIFEIHRKSGGFTKNNKGGLGQFADLRGGLERKREVVFSLGD